MRIDLEFKPEWHLRSGIFPAKAEFTRKRWRYRRERAPVIELLHRYSGLKQRMIAERFGGLDDGLVSRDHRAIREKIETVVSGSHEAKYLSQDLTVRRGSSEANRLESGAGNYRYTPLAKIRFYWVRTGVRTSKPMGDMGSNKICFLFCC
jgi:hypothetical protein